jgi:type III pantothenate kinase
MFIQGAASPGCRDLNRGAGGAGRARLFKVDLEPPQQVIGKNTAAALQSGVIYGFAGQVDAIVRRVREELGEKATALATGGLADPIVPFCAEIDGVDELLPRDPATWAPWTTVSTLTGIVPVNAARMALTRR